MVTIFIKKYSKRRPVTVNLGGWSGDTADARLEKTIAAWPSHKFRFEGDRTVYRQGPLTIVFDATGKAIEGYSYDACLFAFAPPTEDFPAGRLIYNETSYSVTTNSKHRWPCHALARGVVTGEGTRPCAWLDGELETYQIYAQWATRMIVDNMPWQCSPYALLEETRTWARAERAGEQAIQHHAWRREQRAIAKRDKAIAARKHLRLVGGAA